MMLSNNDFCRLFPLTGPNVWSTHPCLEVHIDLTAAARLEPSEATALVDRLSAVWPELSARWQPQASNGHVEQNGHARTNGTPSHNRLAEATGHVEPSAERQPPLLVHCLGLLAHHLQEQSEIGEAFALRFAPGETLDHWKIGLEFDEEHLARDSFNAALGLVRQALAGETFDPAPTTKELRRLADRFCLGPSTRAIVRAALARGIPVHRLNLGSFVQLGHGACQRRIHTAETDRTGAIGEEIASDKELTKELLRTVGVPVPEGRPVESAADAWEAAEEVGVPVVVKPRDGNHGRGVFTGLTTRDEVEAAYEIACQEGSGVLVERFALGSEHRLLVVDGQLAAATRGDPACVTGDGQQTIHELVESQINSDPRRGDAEEFPLARLRFDSIARLLLKQQGFTPDSVPQTDQRVIVQYNGNLSIDVTDEVHPEVAARAVDAARMVGLDVAGLDIVAQDISRPLEEQGGVIVEVNAGPGLQMHVRPSRGRPRPVGAAIVRSLFPHDPAGRIPLVGVYDDREGQPMVAAVGRWLGTDGRCAGWACHAGIFVADRRLTNAPHDERQTVDLLLANNRVEAAAVGVTSRGIISRGLAYNDAHVALVAPRAEGETYNAQRARLLGVLGRALTAGGWLVLPAEDAELIEPYGFEPSRLVLYDLVADAPALQRHRAAGRCTAILRNDQVIVATGNDEIAWTDRKNMARDVAPIDQLAATASQWVLGLLFADQFSTTAAAN